MNKDLAERLLFAAQEVVNDADRASATFSYSIIDKGVMNNLRAVVKEISDEAERELRAILAERR